MLVALGIVYWVIESINIPVDQWYGAAADPSTTVASATLVPVFAGLGVVGLVPLFFFIRNLDRHA
jgi:hypothetical protein